MHYTMRRARREKATIDTCGRMLKSFSDKIKIAISVSIDFSKIHIYHRTRLASDSGLDDQT